MSVHAFDVTPTQVPVLNPTDHAFDMTTTTKLSSTVTVARYRELESADDRAALSEFIIQRFDERYFAPIESAPTTSKHGLASLAVACMVVETLEAFHQGLGDTKRLSGKMFSDFFARETPFRAFGKNGRWFYDDVRCGILHQGAVRGGWRVWRSGPLLDEQAKTINATRFIHHLQGAVRRYGRAIVSDDRCWQLFKKKMGVVCANC